MSHGNLWPVCGLPTVVCSCMVSVERSLRVDWSLRVDQEVWELTKSLREFNFWDKFLEVLLIWEAFLQKRGLHTEKLWTWMQMKTRVVQFGQCVFFGWMGDSMDKNDRRFLRAYLWAWYALSCRGQGCQDQNHVEKDRRFGMSFWEI